jgi:hypothetical protein
MNILNNPISNFSFSDIAQFCAEGQIEGVQLDYKRELPAKGLGKHFSSFSNTRGGLLIIGVEEDSRTGKPIAWEGLVFDTKLVDKIHQYAANVEPRPAYDVHVTDEQEGKVFILVRVFEGDRTPYYVQNDANLYIRTGNITDPIGLASPEAAELLFGKKAKADLARQNYISRTDEIFKASVNKAEKERQHAIANEKEKWKREQKPESREEFRSSYTMDPLGTNTSMCTILLQPFFPKVAITTPQEILAKASQYRIDNSYYGSFPELHLKPIQDGVMNFEWRQDGRIECQQVYATGLLYDADDVLRVSDKGRIIYLSIIATKLFMLLLSASKFYQLFGYQGGLKGFIRLENIDGATIYPVLPEGYHLNPFFFEDRRGPILSKYEWDLELDTALLHDPMSRQKFFLEKIREMYWSLGYENVQEGILEKFLEQNRWLITEK